MVQSTLLGTSLPKRFTGGNELSGDGSSVYSLASVAQKAGYCAGVDCSDAGFSGDRKDVQPSVSYVAYSTAGLCRCIQSFLAFLLGNSLVAYCHTLYLFLLAIADLDQCTYHHASRGLSSNSEYA